MTPTKQTVYLPVKVVDELPKESGFYKTEEEGTSFFQRGDQTWWDNDVDGTKRFPENWLKKEEGYFFTPEQLNEYTENVIKQAAAENHKLNLIYMNKQLEELYTKVENYANQVFGIDNNNYLRSFRLEKGYILVYDKACWHYCDSSDDEEFIITPEDLELPIEEAKEKYQKELQKKHEEEELRKAEAKLKEQKRKEQEEFKLFEVLYQKFNERLPK